MSNLRTLTFMVVGAFVLTILYAAIMSGADIDDDDVTDNEFVQKSERGKSGAYSYRDGDTSYRAEWRGDLFLGGASALIDKTSNEFIIVASSDDHKEKIVLTSGETLNDAAYYVNNERQDLGPETTARKNELITLFLRKSGIRASDRVAHLLKSDGVESVVEELPLIESSHSRRLYATTLVEQTDLPEGLVAPYLQSLDGVTGDHDLRLTIVSVLEDEPFNQQLFAGLIAHGETIASDYEIGRLIEALSDKAPTSQALQEAFVLLKSVDGDYEFRRSVESFLKASTLSEEGALSLIAISNEKSITDKSRRKILTAALNKLQSASAFETWSQSIDVLESATEQRLTIEAAAIHATDERKQTVLKSAAARIPDALERQRAADAINATTQ